MHRPVKQFCITLFCIGAVACASAPEPDPRPALIISAEKSLALGVSNYSENDFSKAESHFERALFLYRNIDNPEGISSSCLNMAKTKLSYGQIEAARAYTEQAQSIIEQEKLDQFRDRLILIQSSIAIEEEDFSTAKQELDRLLELTLSNGNHDIRTAALQNRTRIALLTSASDASDWISQYKTSLNKSGQNTKLNQARLLRFQAMLDKSSSPDNLNNALALYRETAHSPGIAATLYESADYDHATGAHLRAIEKLQRALFIRANLRDRKNSQKALQLLANSYQQSGNTHRSERASYWQHQLDNPAFGQWDSVILEFDKYPD